VLVFGLFSGLQGPDAEAQGPGQRPSSATGEPRTDLHGDPLPVGAVARIGTVRWRTSSALGTLAFSSDGRYLAASGDPTLLFDAASGRLVRKLPADSIYVFFPSDGKTLITASGGYLVSVWDTDTGKERRQIRAVAGATFAWSEDGKMLAIYNYPGGQDPFLSFWDMDSGKKRSAWDWPRHLDIPQQLALAPDGKRLALRARKAIDLFDVASRQRLHVLPSPLLDDIGYAGVTRLVDFSADGKLLACTDGDSVRVWDSATAKSVHRFRMPDDRPLAVLFSPVGGFLAVSGGKAVYLWDLAAGKPTRTLPSPSGLPVHSLAFSHNGKRLATRALHSSAIHLWDVTSGQQLPAPEAPVSPVMGLAFAPDGNTIASLEYFGSVWLWDAHTGKLQRRLSANRSLAHRGWTIALPGGGNTVVAGGFDDGVIGWDRRSGKRLYTRKNESVAPSKQGVPGVQVYPHCSPDGNSLVTVFAGALKREEWPREARGGRAKPQPVYWTRVGVWDPGTAKMARSFQVDAENLGALQLSPDGRRLLGFGELPQAAGRPLVSVWDLAAGRELCRLRMPDTQLWANVALSGDGRTVLIEALHGVQGRKIRFEFWEVATGRRRAEAELAVQAKTALPVGWPTAFADERLAALALKADIYLVDPLSGKVLKCLHGQRELPWHLAFSPDRKQLVSSEDTSALIWDAAVPPLAPEGAPLSAKELAECWADLAGEDAERAYRAVRRLAGCPAQAVAFLGERVRPVPFPQRETLRRLLSELDSGKYAERETATRELVRLGEAAEAALRQFLEDHPSPEARRRAEDILGKLTKADVQQPPAPTGKSLQLLRAVEVLERVRDREAGRLLEALAGGAPHALLTREARAAWQRLARRPPPAR
jgi:WD40 repeat protein